jgi:hypothetical protein
MFMPVMQRRLGRLLFGILGAGIAGLGGPAHAGDALPSEIPQSFTPRVDTFDYTKREVMIPMRDGVKLQTVIIIPRGAHAAPILLTRTPYDASDRMGKKNSTAHLSALLDSSDVADDAVVNGGYIRVLQDVRGKHGSEGDYVMNRLAGEESSGIQRQGGHPRDFLRRVHVVDGAGESASGAARRGAHQCDGRRLDRR